MFALELRTKVKDQDLFRDLEPQPIVHDLFNVSRALPCARGRDNVDIPVVGRVWFVDLGKNRVFRYPAFGLYRLERQSHIEPSSERTMALSE